MQILLTLLISAFQLKVAILGLPVQFEAERQAMLPVTDSIIASIQMEMAQSPQSPLISLPMTSQPSVEVSSEASSTPSVPVSIQGLKNEYTVYGGACSEIRFQVYVLHSDRTIGESDSMVMETPDLDQDAQYSSTLQPSDHSLIFSYIPRSVNVDETVTFSTGDISQSVVIHVGSNPFLDAKGEVLQEKIDRASIPGAEVRIENGKCVRPFYDVR